MNIPAYCSCNGVHVHAARELHPPPLIIVAAFLYIPGVRRDLLIRILGSRVVGIP